jgi:peptidoglycan/xylan/chitin deacetylase (PgdA/CDA1 family)
VSLAKPGAVVLMHDGGGKRANTIAALPQIITKLRALGYRFVTLDEMFGSKPAAAAPKTAPKTAPKVAPKAKS